MTKAPGAQCFRCPLLDASFVPCTQGLEDPELIVVGEAPGMHEVMEGVPFVGPSGKLLDAAIEQAGNDPAKVFRTNMVSCRPPKNRDPTPEEIDCCRPRLMLELQKHPKTRILAVGRYAQEHFLGADRERIRGMWTKRVVGTWHPAYVLRKPAEASAFLRDVKKACAEPRYSPAQDQPKALVADTYEKLVEHLSTVPQESDVAFDLETNQVIWYDRPGIKGNSIMMLSLAWDPSFAVIVPDPVLYDDPRTKTLFEGFWKNNNMIGHNAKFDVVFMRTHLGANVHADFDTMLAHHLLDENSRHGLKELATEEFGVPDYEKQLISKYLKTKSDEYSKVPFEELSKYAAWDVTCTLELKKRFERRLREQSLYRQPFMNVAMEGQHIFSFSEIRGVHIDVPYLEMVGGKLDEELERIRYKMGKDAGKPHINLNSPQQVAEVLWDDLSLRPKKSRKYKIRSTCDAATTHLIGKHPWVDLLRLHRGVAKLKSSYVKNVLRQVDVDGDIHPNILLHGTEIGRLSARNPAVQTIPRVGDQKDKEYSIFADGALIRGSFIPHPGMEYVIADYSQAELRTYAAMSQEPYLMDAYEIDRDIHSEVAIGMFGEDFTKENRVLCKMFNFSYVYGGNEYSFAVDANLPVAKARQFVRDYDKLMPVGKKWKGTQFKHMLREGWVKTRFNRLRRFPLITNANRDDARKASVHAPVAGTAADINTLACIEAHYEGFQVLFPVHDSILLECPKGEGQKVGEQVREIMLNVASRYVPEVPWKVDVEVGDRWATPPVFE